MNWKYAAALAVTATVGALSIGMTHFLAENSRGSATFKDSYQHVTGDITSSRVSSVINEVVNDTRLTDTEYVSEEIPFDPGGQESIMDYVPSGDEWITSNPIDGDVIKFPEVGEVFSGRVINTQQVYNLPRSENDVVTWEFAYGYVSNSSRFPRMRARAQALSNCVVNPTSPEALRVRLDSGEEVYVGCLPIAGFGSLGDIIEFTYTDGTTMKVLCVDSKATNDAPGTGSTNQANTDYCHAVKSGDTWRLSAIELWCGGSATANARGFPNAGKNVSQAKIVGHSDIFSGL